ncbi:division/cell wall cluster transcriptional repressor MraZ [candidate division WWE3 bacterium RIFCSPHIGHO2_12_FULL_38_15]|uniref:Transcriptional regulator MraZ n=1 Tax=candidate division WWE3 bacterium RIFCSPHIGHO2_02_FULL_38_14 TaxID=1802620 RepID=A0A1F4VA97_UNCKA|nr:MAG: division/cell wall cluster transcriptional repressor MraZ [candidate division WWE3 bacterium RIFCSPHIGHO2_01_FULL_38_45]OGC49156.1 MAG: division/cell wall cluster transcriptional repressor MraZ [candidate division WWE3 bacterium RIFCSPHIGHO2_12_FULL_38_15]OGC52578.1 MAG: division/cell wall cluster transcriptional repressor MraZ [candidate division WWE3 bacterium RIFCSPLOWO2_01_FULL_37_24]OGC54069.1 MAG: division/cell wall cluster transcriptional repressor MraZ [candidate division WWE3 ba
MFLGEYQPNITEGSRIALPKKLRDQIRGEEVILLRGFEQCIFLYDKEDWVNEANKQIENPITDPKFRNLKRYLYANAAEMSIDAQGRVVLPSSLKNYAGIDKKSTVIGAGDHIEIWDTDIWNAHLEKISEDFAQESKVEK